MESLRQYRALRWVLVWPVASFLIAGVLIIVGRSTHQESGIGSDLLSAFITIVMLSAPWFLWGEIASRFIASQRMYSPIRRVASVLFLLALLLGAVYWTGIFLIDL